MAWQTSKRVWDKCPHTVIKNDRLMLLALAELSDEYGVCWPGYDLLASMIGVDPRTATRLIQHLESENQIICLKQSGQNGGRGYTNLYFIITGLNSNEIDTISKTHPVLVKKGDKLYTLLEQKKGDKIEQKGDKIEQKGDKIEQKGDIAMSPEPCEPCEPCEPKRESHTQKLKRIGDVDFLQQNELFARKLAEICGNPHPRYVANSDRRKLAEATAQLLDWGATVKQLDEFKDNWKFDDSPWVNQVVSHWGRFLSSSRNGGKNGAATILERTEGGRSEPIGTAAALGAALRARARTSGP